MIDRRQGRGDRCYLSGARGQTLQDYTIGISLFLVTVAAVLAGLLGFTSPLTAGVSAEDVSQSERVSAAMVGNLSTARQPNELDASRLSTTLGRPVEQLRNRWGIERTTSLNVSLVTLNGTRIVERGGTRLTAGASSTNRSTAMVGNHSTGRQPNELDASQLSTTMNQPVEQLRTRWGIERTTSLNVSLVTLNGTRIVDRGGNELAVGASATNRSTATASRVVTFDDGTCDPSCRLVVRTW